MSTSARFDARDLARIAIFAALIVALGTAMVPIPGGVPITGQTLGVMLAGIVLGARRGAMSVLVVLALAAVGLPVLTGGRGGLSVFVGPSAGYMFGWVAGVIVTGLIVHKGAQKLYAWRVISGAIVGGILVVYLFGIPVQALATGIALAPTALSSMVFLPGDLAKVAVATALSLALYRAYPPAFGEAFTSRKIAASIEREDAPAPSRV